MAQNPVSGKACRVRRRQQTRGDKAMPSQALAARTTCFYIGS
jgi:hypothetical protein